MFNIFLEHLQSSVITLRTFSGEKRSHTASRSLLGTIFSLYVIREVVLLYLSLERRSKEEPETTFVVICIINIGL